MDKTTILTILKTDTSLPELKNLFNEKWLLQILYQLYDYIFHISFKVHCEYTSFLEILVNNISLEIYDNLKSDLIMKSVRENVTTIYVKKLYLELGYEYEIFLSKCENIYDKGYC